MVDNRADSIILITCVVAVVVVVVVGVGGIVIVIVVVVVVAVSAHNGRFGHALEVQVLEHFGVGSVESHAEALLNGVHGRLAQQHVEPLIGLAHAVRVRMEDDVVDHARLRATLVLVFARRRARVRQLPVEAGPAVAFAVLGCLVDCRRGLVNVAVLAYVDEALALAVLCRLEAEAGLRVNERGVDAALLLQLDDLLLVELAVLRVRDLLGVLDKQLAELLLLHGLRDARQLIFGNVQVGELVVACCLGRLLCHSFLFLFSVSVSVVY